MIKRLLQKYSLKYNFCKQKKKTNFGYKQVQIDQKQLLINKVFSSISQKYDLMNNIISFGSHNYWKDKMVQQLGKLTILNLYTYKQNKQKINILDVAGGTGDIAFRILKSHERGSIKVIVLDINQNMIKEGKQKAYQLAYTNQEIQFICANAEQLPFQNAQFDAYTISFGLRNIPRIRQSINQAKRVLKYGGRWLCLEFSTVSQPLLKELYKQYSFKCIPLIGQIVSSDKQSYKYLVQSIDKFLNQQQLLQMINNVGLKQCKYENIFNGIVALHSGYKLIE